MRHFSLSSYPKSQRKTNFLFLNHFHFDGIVASKSKMVLSTNFWPALLLNQSFEIRNCIMKEHFSMITHKFCLGFWVCFLSWRIPLPLKVQSGKWLSQMPSASLFRCIFCLLGLENRTTNYSLDFSCFFTHLTCVFLMKNMKKLLWLPQEISKGLFFYYKSKVLID